MMSATVYPALLAASGLLGTFTTAQAQSQNYVVHSTVIFARTGEHTPFLAPDSVTLTSWGARQMFNLGSFFRRRYIASAGSSPSPTLTGLSIWELDNDQVSVLTANAEATAAGAQSFMQGLYPPFKLPNGTAGSSSEAGNQLSDGTYVPNPLDGYQYPLIQTFTAYDPGLIYLSGESNCIMNEIMESQYYSGTEFAAIAKDTGYLYNTIGQTILKDVMTVDKWSYSNAYIIHDYVNYMYNHNATIQRLLDTPAYQGFLEQLHDLASRKQYALHGDLGVSGITPGDHILAISGRTLAAKVLGLLYLNIASFGAYSKVNVMVGDYEPMLALFSLLGLPQFNANFATLPNPGSALVFELFSWENSTRSIYTGDGVNYPSRNNLRVRFSFRNSTGDGTTDVSGLQAYPIFGRGPSEMDMPYTDFQAAMQNIMLSYVGEWCYTCQSASLFCAAFNTSLIASGPDMTVSTRDPEVTPQVAGVIGASVTLGVLLLLGLAAAALAGVRVKRAPGSGLLFGGALFKSQRRASSLGGFKGSAKLQSDADLHIPKNAAPIGVSVVPTSANPFGDEAGGGGAAAAGSGGAVAAAAGADPKGRGHERVGSWELKEKDGEYANPTLDKDGRFSSLTGSTVGSTTAGASVHRVSRPSFEEDERVAEEEIDRIGAMRPVRSEDRV